MYHMGTPKKPFWPLKALMRNKHQYIWLASFLLNAAWFSDVVWSGEKQNESTLPAQSKVSIFAGGCFWCMEPPFDKLEGVILTESGYTGGHVKNPNYKQVSNDNTGHYEAIRITYDSTQVDYKTLLTVFWHNVDPLNSVGQFCDNGDSYRTAIFYTDEEQKDLAEKSKFELSQSKYFELPIFTPIISAKEFYLAESYHQDYYKKNPIRYNYYRFVCGRDKRLNQLWKGSAGKAGALIPSE